MTRAWLPLAAAIVGCSTRENPTVLRDTLGTSFTWSCPASGCSFEAQITTPPVPADCKPGSGYGWVSGRFFDVCYFEPLSSSGYAILGESCRPVVCAKDDDCPWAAFGGGLVFLCKNGLCQSTEPLGANELEELCLAREPRPMTCDPAATLALPAVKHAIDLLPANCSGRADGGSCSVPSECLQP